MVGSLLDKAIVLVQGLSGHELCSEVGFGVGKEGSVVFATSVVWPW